MDEIAELYRITEKFATTGGWDMPDLCGGGGSGAIYGWTFRPMFKVCEFRNMVEGRTSYFILFNPHFRIDVEDAGSPGHYYSEHWEESFTTVEEYKEFISHPGFHKLKDIYHSGNLHITSKDLEGTLFDAYKEKRDAEYKRKYGK